MKAWREVDLFTGEVILPKLTPSEENVLRALCSGRSQKEIANLLDVHPNTVYFHLFNVRRKWGAESTMRVMVLWLRSRQRDQTPALSENLTR